MAPAALGARQVSAHLSFPGDEPHSYDRWHNENAEAWRRESSPTREEVGVQEPYYRDPFERLVALHRPTMGRAETTNPASASSDARDPRLGGVRHVVMSASTLVRTTRNGGLSRGMDG